MDSSENERVTVEMAVEILKKNGLEVTSEEAKSILDLLYKFADISLSQCMVKPP